MLGASGTAATLAVVPVVLVVTGADAVLYGEGCAGYCRCGTVRLLLLVPLIVKVLY